MRKVLIVALGLAGAGAVAPLAFAKSVCEEQRDACYSEIGQASDQVAAKNKCAADYERCVAGDLAQAKNSPVATVPGLGAPMVQPYAASGVNPPPALGNSRAASVTSVRGAAGNLVKVSPPAKPPPRTTAASSSSSQRSSGSSPSGGGAKPGSNGSSTSLRQN